MTHTEILPTVFIGHGSPMNAIEENTFTRALGALGQRLPRPRAVLCVSAHWMTTGTFITHMPKPRTIHDFYGFPEELFAVQYPASGSPEAAELIQSAVPAPVIGLDDSVWGLDHGAWSVLCHMYPEADIPTLQLSLAMDQPAAYHLDLGRQLRGLRRQGILILGSGNVVHNLRRLRWEPGAAPYDWAIEFDDLIRRRLLARDTVALLTDPESPAGRLSVPTPDHYLPLLYTVGAADAEDELHFDYESIELGSISMRSFTFSRKTA